MEQRPARGRQRPGPEEGWSAGARGKGLKGGDDGKQLRNPGLAPSPPVFPATPPPGSPLGPQPGYSWGCPQPPSSYLCPWAGASLRLLCPPASSLWHLGSFSVPGSLSTCSHTSAGRGAAARGLTSVEQGAVLVQGPQAVEGTEPTEHGPQLGRDAGPVRVLVEPAHHSELQERQGQGAAAIHLQTATHR